MDLDPFPSSAAQKSSLFLRKHGAGAVLYPYPFLTCGEDFPLSEMEASFLFLEVQVLLHCSMLFVCLECCCGFLPL